MEKGTMTDSDYDRYKKKIKKTGEKRSPDLGPDEEMADYPEVNQSARNKRQGMRAKKLMELLRK